MTRPTAAATVSVSARAAAPEANALSGEHVVRKAVSASAFDRLFGRFVARARTYEAALILLELEGFRAVQERWGLLHGDDLREELVERTVRAAGHDAVVGRMGTNELAILLPLPSDGPILEERVNALRQVLEARTAASSDGSSIVVRLGAARIGADVLDPVTIRHHAQMALLRASVPRAGGTALYDDALHQELGARARLLDEIRRGAEAGELVLHYQPICDLEGRSRGFEALMRWNHPTRGLLAPFHFLVAFDHPELSVLLGDLAIRTAVTQMRSWQDAGIDFGYVAVNLATEQFAAGDLADRVAGVLAELQIAPRQLMLEVTETVYLDRDAGRIVATLASLRELGVRVALDDFGTGYASLSHLKTLPVDRLKIDRAFVSGLELGLVDAAIVGAVVMLGKSLGVEVVAEGVETPAQLEILRQSGCERIQGFLFSKPLAPRAASEFTQRSPRLRPSPPA